MVNEEDTPLLAKDTKHFHFAQDIESTPSLEFGSSPKLPRYQSFVSVKSVQAASVASSAGTRFLYYIIYAVVNVIISAPALYGYAAVIFNHPVYAGHMNALSKLVIFSSLVHQLGFTLFSGLPFSIGTVQDAGLIFLSAMANVIANQMEDDGDDTKAVVSTALVLLALGTAALGLVLVIVGKSGLANAVSYLPMSVVGGYLAFIGYFCIQAGTSLCISKSLSTLADWIYMLQPKNILLAFPGILSGLILTWVPRNIKSEAALPIAMVIIPLIFYIVIFTTGIGLEGAREAGWVGQVAPSVPVSDLFSLVDFSLVRWDLILQIYPTWIGMVFVVSFASCLDVAAISMDMGEALDTNNELATVGICNIMSGLLCGFTGSYIFSQTIFTYRTGVHSRWVGIFITGAFFYIVCSPINILQISPLFFLGATLIFIGFDLLYEWLWEIRHQVFLSEYSIVWLTFLAIQVVGINAGIVIGVIVAVIQQTVLTAKTCTVAKVPKRSRAVWSKEEAKLLYTYGYNPQGPKIVTLEISGTIFFGSSLQLYNEILRETGLDEIDAPTDGALDQKSPHTSSFVLTMDRKPSMMRDPNKSILVPKTPPRFLVLDVSHVTNLDSSGTRNCFQQLTKIMCEKKGMTVCVAGPTPRIDYMLRSHSVAFTHTNEEKMKAQLQSSGSSSYRSDRMLLFVNAQEALEFCETVVLHRIHTPGRGLPPMASVSGGGISALGPNELCLSSVITHILSASDDEKATLSALDDGRYSDEIELQSGDVLFERDRHPDAFYIVVSGAIANTTGSKRALYRHKVPVLTGAGLVQETRSSSLREGLVPLTIPSNEKIAARWGVGGVLGYVDFLQDRPRHFRAISVLDGTRLAKVTHSHMNLMEQEDPVLFLLIQKLLLQSSVADLSNCTCDDV